MGSDGADGGYVVEIKPSARRSNGAVGRTVNREGPRHRFSDREDAERWATVLDARGEGRVWIRSANPNDGADVDAYLMSRRPAEGDLVAVRPVDADDRGRDRDRGGAGEDSRDQTAVEEYAPE